MKRFLFILIISAVITGTHAQNRGVARGAAPGELYVTGTWYMIYGSGGPPHYDSIQKALFRLTENGKKLTVQYVASYFYSNPETTIIPVYILADATSGVVYLKDDFSKNSYRYTSLWVSFDYGKHWTFREENMSLGGYLSGSHEGVMYKGIGGVFRSNDYGASFTSIPIPKGAMSELGLLDCEGFSVGNQGGSSEYRICHGYDCGQTVNYFPIDSQFIFGQMGGIFPDVYRGGLPGEVYIDSWFPDSDSNPNWTYKVSFSADTGQTFRHVYISEPYGSYAESFPAFMTDREPGVFYVIRYYEVEDFDPWGSHLRLCVEHYTDYGETLAGIYCHDVTKDYVNEVGIEEVGEMENVVVYPNPTRGELRVESGEWRVESVEVFDLLGRKMLEQKAESKKQKELDISHLPSGMYFVRIVMETGAVVRKVVKQ